MSEANYDPRFVAAVNYFNECEFFEAHEEWEEVWQEYQGPSRKFYQGLIQVAVCLHHFGNGNLGGARKLYHSSRKYLQEYPEMYEGVNLAGLLEQMENCCQDILSEDASGVEIDPELIPEIHLDPAPDPSPQS